jgi:pyruvate dehydrogenase E1 component alpha subunit/2-oxoisovalerate dehydrogenase E1 component alpha subunit
MAGIALSFKVRGEDRVGLAFCGDGATSTGAWHEGLAFAAAERCPLVLMVEANQWSFSTPVTKATRVESFTQKAAGYGLHASSTDGTDVIAVVEATRAAVERARAGEGAGLVELRYYRRVGHAQHDDQAYVDPDEIRAWEERDPVANYRRRLLDEGWAAEDELAGLEAKARRTADEAAEKALLEPMPEGPMGLDGVYSDVPTLRPWTRRADPRPRPRSTAVPA